MTSLARALRALATVAASRRYWQDKYFLERDMRRLQSSVHKALMAQKSVLNSRDWEFNQAMRRSESYFDEWSRVMAIIDIVADLHSEDDTGDCQQCVTHRWPCATRLEIDRLVRRGRMPSPAEQARALDIQRRQL